MTACAHCGSPRVLHRTDYVWCADCGRTTSLRQEQS